ncbi:putative 1-phosphatidylinositol-3-phosphate 5-kinase FAB1C [Dichanthelium oligosanthes]|uniref:1-phosphatidylinositol-3-phosphate 5-kinase n=1 Tax=Dichanthelium oligosanthes TaxID=888268 RepID=A0A1E5UQ01_9POAL|nr:putative 1-phosphatidylinositol-3-phosphate 5-kinase FAB1C [Dichanthelium oligosanthes]
MGVLEFAVEKARSLAAAADHDPCHAQKGELARIETRRRQEAGHGVGTPRAQGAASPVGPPTPPRRPPEARSGGEGGAGTRCHPPCRDIRRVEEAADEPGAQFLAPGTDFLHDFSDTDSSVSVSNSMYRSMTSSPAESPTCMVRLDDTSDHDVTAMTDSDDAREQVSAGIADEGEEVNTLSCIVDFGDDIWCPPPPDDERDDVESRIFGIDDEDDDVLSEPSSFSANKIAGVNGIYGGAHKDGVQNDLLKHFRALVAQLLKVEGISLASDNDSKSWLEIVSSLAWQAANYVKPDTKKGGSMDPGDYVKIKCIASGNPTDSNFVRGIVCSKNVRHKRMVSEHRNAKLLILGGALEYQKVSNKLASIGTILEQEKEHLRTVVGKIESRQPNVLLVEKSASSFAQELLVKDISLVLNVKRPLLDRISRCTGGQVASSIDNIVSARLGQCDLFKVEKVPESMPAEHTEKGSTKTLMFFEGCLKRLGCTVLLRGNCREELKKIKRAMQLAVFAAYHLSLETSFLADEGATIPRIPSMPVLDAPELQTHRDYISARPADHSIPDNLRDAEEKYPHNATISQIFENISASSTLLPFDGVSQGTMPECRASGFPVDHINSQDLSNLRHPNASCIKHLISPRSLSDGFRTSCAVTHYDDSFKFLQSSIASDACHDSGSGMEPFCLENCTCHPSIDNLQSGSPDDKDKLSAGYLSGTDNNQSILVSLSSTCIPKSLTCERSHLVRIKFYGSFDKPLGRYLREDLFDQAYCCPSCKEPSESHVRCYMHQHGSLMISVRRLLSQKLPGEHDGRIWMWHRCMRCKPKDGMPPATHRVIMSDAAWGLSFGKFLELSFSNHMTANRIASCGHSLQRDCLRFYGYGNMVAAFQYSPMVTLCVNLPPPVLDFNFHATQEWVQREAVEVFGKMESLHREVYDLLHNIEKSTIAKDDSVKTSMQRQIMEMKDLLNMERNEYEALLLPVMRESAHSFKSKIDILELNRIRRGLFLDAHTWDCRLCGIDSLKEGDNISRTDSFNQEEPQGANEGRPELHHTVTRLGGTCQEPCPRRSSGSPRKSLLSTEGHSKDHQSVMVEKDLPIGLVDGVAGDAGGLDLVFSKFNIYEGHHLSKDPIKPEPVERLPSLASILADKIDMAWSGSGELQYNLPHGLTKADENKSFSLLSNPSCKKATAPVRIHSFDAVLRLHQREQTGLVPASLHSALKPADSFRDLSSLVKDPMTNMRRAFSQISPRARGNLNAVLTRAPKYITSASDMMKNGARLLLPNISCEGSVVVTVYDDEPTSVVSYAMTSQEYVEHVTHKINAGSSFSDFTRASSNRLDGSSSLHEDLSDLKGIHFRFYFDDDASSADSTKFSVTCYFARQFDALRKKCCPSDIDYIRSLSRCKRWSAQGGKSNVYFAKTMDERFIIKQVTKTELDSFVEFAPHYFRHLTESLSSRSPTCLAKIMGLYQVGIKSLKGGREVKMDLMVMENIFFQKTVSRVYDLKGSVRSRYNSDTSGHNRVLLDSNLIEALHTKPMFLGSKAKRKLERAVWNDTSFLASLDVMDYSLLVGIDEEKKELVVGIIDFLRQYTWDKQLETWVKASGILGGPKNEPPTVISPIQYKKRFRKAMSRYFLAVPDHWTS